MSDYVVKLIPTDPFMSIPTERLEKAVAFIREHIECDEVEVSDEETPEFIDCGENLESITCPECGSELDLEWWGEAMNEVWESEFDDLTTKMPCCGKSVSLNDLEYNLPCGFACCVIEIWNPEDPLDDEMLDSLQKILGTTIRKIDASI